jgi:UDPglucose--hexose-1-phosphate uridylyltransferase
VPFAASVPYEMWIMPRADQSSFTMLSDPERLSFAETLQRGLLRLASVCGDVDYNFIIHSCPLKDEEEYYYVWHLQIIPRLTQPAGLELGSRMYINPVLPEAAAEQLRRALACSGRNAIGSDTVLTR